MRRVGFAVAFLIASGNPVVAEPPSELDRHLAGWEQSMKRTKGLSAWFEMVRVDPIFKRETKCEGKFALLQPNMGRCTFIGEKPGALEIEAYAWNAKSVFAYDLRAMTVTELPASFLAEYRQFMFSLIFGMTADAAKTRFDISLVDSKNDEIVALLLRPRQAKEKKQIESARVSLHSPKVKVPNEPYQVVGITMKKPDGITTETWIFRDHSSNDPKLSPESFDTATLPGKDWKLIRIPPAKASQP